MTRGVDTRVVVYCPACGGQAHRMQRGAPAAEPGIFVVYPCGCWLAPERAKALRATYQEAVERARTVRPDDAESPSRSAPTVTRSAEPQDPWTG